jgi:hypothetical protein
MFALRHAVQGRSLSHLTLRRLHVSQVSWAQGPREGRLIALTFSCLCYETSDLTRDLRDIVELSRIAGVEVAR